MYLARHDLRASTGRFVLVGAVIGLIAMLSVLLSGLATGLVDDGISGLRAQPLTHLVMQEGSKGTFSNSVVTDEAIDVLGALEAEVSALGVSFFNGRSDRGTRVELVLFGVSQDSFLVERPDAREALAKPASIVVSQAIADAGVEVGDRVTLLGNDLELTVVGVTAAGSYGHVPIAYTSVGTWQQALYGTDARGRYSAVAVKADDQAIEALDIADTDLEVITKTTAFAGSPGYSAETSTMRLIRGFLVLISALVVGAFFTVWSVQRTREIGLMKALGASDRYVVLDAMGQIAMVLLAAIVIGGLIGCGLGMAVPGAVPFRLDPRSIIGSLVVLAVAGVVGSAVTVRRISSVDPLVSLGADR